ncbi:LysR substrate-binding domain-containing protein [Streptomyces sp. SID2888]|uniref:LysR substrate-binding domain-containing protein n=1 Tax=Streptomyces TaxID=1883 RepID=UPI0013710A66|nr:LysR substrate-binding domain-containing protein [Streptomyces sp. SID2888]MYV46284.1 LysR family transcriptional regulator [Streptomyces sp. SID2888]
MELRHVRSFLALVEERHFGRAAARLHIAQPALSQQIKQLERDLGTVLFTRSTRRVELTEAGADLTAYARSILAEVERAEAHMAMLASGHAGRVSIGFVGTATYDVLPQVARTVRAELPAVSLELHGELLAPQLVEGLLDGAYDLALFRPGPAGHSGIRVVPLRTERLVAVLPSHHPLVGRRRIPLAALADEPFVVHPSRERSSMHERVLAACARAGFEPATLVEVGETSTLVVFVAAGHGVALVPESVQSLRVDGVTYLPLAETETVDLGLARRTGHNAPATERVAAVIESCVRH